MNKIFILFLPFLLMACEKNSALTVENDPEKPVYNRQKAFKEILNAFEPMGLMRRGEMKFDFNLYEKNAKILNDLKNKPWRFFKENTFYPPSRSKENIIENKTEWENEIQQYQQAVENLNEVIQQKEKNKIELSYDNLHKTCRSCHQKFRR